MEEADIPAPKSALRRFLDKFGLGSQRQTQAIRAENRQQQQEIAQTLPEGAEVSQITQSGKVAREARKQAYEAARAKPEGQAAGSLEIAPENTAERQRNFRLPSGFERVRRSEHSLALSPEDLPWLDQDERIPLVEVSLAGTDGKRFLLGSVIRGKELIEAANQLDTHRKEITDNLLYSRLPGFISEGHHPYIKLTTSARTTRPIYNIYNKGGQRVYFMRFDNIDDLPVIIRIAVCDKDRQAQVLGVITNLSRKAIKQSGKL